MEETQFRYDVALSFAEEDRKFVRCVFIELRDKGLRVYYDENEQVDMWGKNLYDLLDDIYQNQSRYCVVFISKYYKEKNWTSHERKSAQARAIREKGEYLLPFRLDDTEIREFSNTTTYLDRDKFDWKELANAIYQKVNKDPNQEAIAISNSREIKLPFPTRIRKRLTRKTISLAATFMIGGSAIFGLWDRFTPVDTLAQKIYIKSKYNFRGAICKDGWLSHSRGSGTCSHHGGVDHYFDSVAYNKTMKQCRDEASNISWLSP